MTQRRQLADAQGNPLLKDFGAFYPTGYLVIAFERGDDARQTCHELRVGGYDEQDCAVHEPRDVAERAHRNINNAGLMARLGKSIAAVKKHASAAGNGATFLTVYAPDDVEAERVMNVVRRRPHVLAHRYQRFAIQDLAERDEEAGATSAR
ncbi:MAG: hypothetical protein H0V62_08985 [Gammaproteobacteria bacterium]|nr:hypothetical protein [Gammaproteobacteria bacterium]